VIGWDASGAIKLVVSNPDGADRLGPHTQYRCNIDIQYVNI
jgi:hypothetical protein